ncbi:MAG: hypothetical protein LRZ92_02095, partial [Methanosarcinaceae archaeon]|nr:hypothetical protein [Methanosarcinaceae archaeon]
EEIEELKNGFKKKLKNNKFLSNEYIEKFLSNEFKKAIEDIIPYLRHETVLKEYRDIRKSFETHRTYSEASKLFIREMNLIKSIRGDGLKKIILNLYKFISNYGESIIIPIIWAIAFIAILPIIAITIAYSINAVPDLYFNTLEQVFRAFFQLRMFPPENMAFIIHFEPIVRIVSLILLSNIVLTVGRQLKRR